MKQTPRPTPKARTQKTPRRNHAKTEREQDPVQASVLSLRVSKLDNKIFRCFVEFVRCLQKNWTVVLK